MIIIKLIALFSFLFFLFREVFEEQTSYKKPLDKIQKRLKEIEDRERSAREFHSQSHADVKHDSEEDVMRWIKEQERIEKLQDDLNG